MKEKIENIIEHEKRELEQEKCSIKLTTKSDEEIFKLCCVFRSSCVEYAAKNPQPEEWIRN